MLRRDPCVAADPNGPAATLHGGARRRHVASCRAAQANHLPRAQLQRFTALGSPWPAPPHASQPQGPELDLAEAEGPSRLPLRWLPPCGP